MRKTFVLILIVLGALLSLSSSAQKYRIVSDNTWKASNSYASGWQKTWFDDSAWGNSVEEPNTGSVLPGLAPVTGTKGMWVKPYADSAYFRKSFILKTNCVVSGFNLFNEARYKVDDEITIYVNGVEVVPKGPQPTEKGVIINPFLKVGKNVIAIKAYNRPTTSGPGKYMVSFGVDIDYTTGAGPEITMSADQSVCEGDSASFEPNQTYPSYLWNNGDVTKITTVSKSGKYWVTAKDTTGCDWIDTVELVSFPHIDVNLGADKVICPGQSVTLDASGYAHYNWSNGDTTPTITVNYQGQFYVDVTDANGCTSSDTVNITRFNNASVDIGDDTSICVGERIILDATFPFSSYLWEDGSTNPLRSVSDPGTYAVTVTNACGQVTDNRVISNITEITVDLGDDDFLCGYQYYELVADAKGAISYAWQLLPEPDTIGTTPRIAVEDPGVYSVSVVDKCGNEGYDEKELLGGLDKGLVAANSFTPNNDDLNETWRADIFSYGEYSLEILNKWGNVVFTANDPLESWDGKYEGAGVPSGTYVFKITYVDCEAQTKIITGYLNVVL
ncbi:MAG: gliding motility-associated C-terminal domain-containing protein [Salibacteraceae bacterium]